MSHSRLITRRNVGVKGLRQFQFFYSLAGSCKNKHATMIRSTAVGNSRKLISQKNDKRKCDAVALDSSAVNEWIKLFMEPERSEIHLISNDFKQSIVFPLISYFCLLIGNWEVICIWLCLPADVFFTGKQFHDPGLSNARAFSRRINIYHAVFMPAF